MTGELMDYRKSKHSFRLTVFAVALTLVVCLPTGAAIGIYWGKHQVLPVVFVKPSIGGFAPIDGISIGNTWSKDEVLPICLVEPSIGGFVPIQGNPIGNLWRKDEVKPFVEVTYSLTNFVPVER